MVDLGDCAVRWSGRTVGCHGASHGARQVGHASHIAGEAGWFRFGIADGGALHDGVEGAVFSGLDLIVGVVDNAVVSLFEALYEYEELLFVCLGHCRRFDLVQEERTRERHVG